MKKHQHYLALLLIASMLNFTAAAQTITITGNVKNSGNKDAVPAVSVTVKGSPAGTFTNEKGDFKLTTVEKLPLTLIISSIGFETKEVTVSNLSTPVQVDFAPTSSLGTEVVVSASRVPQRILESPVSIERISAANIRNAPAVSYYDVLSNLKGVDVTTSSLTFKTPSTRGFNASGNTRLNQLVDGMDNQAPGLNFSVGGVVGLTELDVDNIELLPGASSALYGPGGMNGTILISSKNPFKYQGLSFQVKEGIMNTDSRFRSLSPYHNWSVRWAEKVSDRFAFKIGMELVAAKDWLGYDKRNYSRTGTNGKIIDGDRASDPNYDGINVYGDETTTDIRSGVFPGIATSAPFLKGFLDTLNGGRAMNVSRTGYNENEAVNQNTLNYKLSGALHYKLSSKTEVILGGHWGTGNTVYTGSERYSLRNLKIGQYKIEFNNPNWMIRAYTTQENAGESYNATVTTRLVNEAWKPSGGSTGWFSQYTQAYIGARLTGASDYAAQTLARATADIGRPAANSDQFKALFDQVRSIPISKGGGLFLDKTNLYMIEGQANLSPYTKNFADIIVGANYKKYLLNSEGTLFADSTGKIGIEEFGAYAQATRSLLNDVLKLSVSGRYDKNQNFKGKFTPRVTLVIKVAENNNFRVSYQTAYRFPSTQQQWINLNIGSNTQLIGGNKSFIDFYKLKSNPTYELSTSSPPTVNTTPYSYPDSKAESVTTYELGYKGLVTKSLLIDAYGYYGEYSDFLYRTLVIQPKTTIADVVTGLANNVIASNLGRIFSIPANTTTKVKTYGFGLSVDYRLPLGFIISGNISSDNLKDAGGFRAAFSTPKYRTNLSLANNGFGTGKRLGFNVTWRWQDSFNYDGDFGNGDVPAVHTLDAQVSYKVPNTKVALKIGANNLLNQYYINGIGNSIVGGLYYVAFAYNVF
ncbi:MAG TPA: TonB-dependent receptor [Chitinophagaceae bacterium]|nr:TonB-dependent receptor [Chitinophagaceae bacterium]